MGKLKVSAKVCASERDGSRRKKRQVDFVKVVEFWAKVEILGRVGYW